MAFDSQWKLMKPMQQRAENRKLDTIVKIGWRAMKRPCLKELS